jgi:hypothetical protein
LDDEDIIIAIYSYTYGYSRRAMTLGDPEIPDGSPAALEMIYYRIEKGSSWVYEGFSKT